MDSMTVFNALIQTIETSNLNYCMNKTPFSARISIKSSFINRFDNQQTFERDPSQLNLKEKLDFQEKKIFQLESELSKPQEENSTVIDMLNDEKVRIKVFNESSKKTVEVKSNLIS